MAEWTTAVPADALADDEMIGVAIDGHDVAIYRVGGKYYATDNVCSHGLALLTDGFLEGMEVECPLHAGRFEIASGKGLGEPIACDIRSYPVRVHEGQIQVLIGVKNEATA